MKRATVALLLETLRLRDGLTRERAQAAWSAADLRGLMPLLRHEGAQTWLYRKLEQLEAQAPAELTSSLRTAAHAATRSNMRIDAQTSAITDLLRSASIDCVLIKGQARRAASSRYPYADARAVSDVDLLVPEDRLEDAWTHLVQNGFRPLYEDRSTPRYRGQHHSPPLINEADVAVELHWTILPRLRGDECWRRMTRNADRVMWNDVETYVANATELVWQAVTHGVLDELWGYRLRTMLSAAAILASEADIDWDLFRNRLASGEVVEWFSCAPIPAERVLRYLAVCASLAGVKVPESLRPRSTAQLLPLLRWRGWVLSSSLPRSVRERLMEESTRAELLLPITPAAEGRGMLRMMRRRGSSIIARACYTAWRAVQ